MGIFLEKWDLREKGADEEAAAYEGTPGLMGRDRSQPVPAVGGVYFDRKFIKPVLTNYEFNEGAGPTDQPPAQRIGDEEMN